jgi:hypothetical protein
VPARRLVGSSRLMRRAVARPRVQLPEEAPGPLAALGAVAAFAVEVLTTVQRSRIEPFPRSASYRRPHMPLSTGNTVRSRYALLAHSSP